MTRLLLILSLFTLVACAAPVTPVDAGHTGTVVAKGHEPFVWLSLEEGSTIWELQGEKASELWAAQGEVVTVWGVEGENYRGRTIQVQRWSR